MECQINDIRNEADFKGITFSKYKRTEVRKELINNIITSKIEQSCYWSVELICAGLYSELWEIIILTYTKYIHIGNPKLSIYLDIKFQQFKDIMMKAEISELYMRNNNKIRVLFGEIICMLCISKKKHSYDQISVTKNDFNMTEGLDRFKAPNINFGNKWKKEKDPKCLLIGINELAYNLSVDVCDAMAACYWIEWILEYGSLCKKKKEVCVLEPREYIPVETKYITNIVWIIWDILMGECQQRSKLLEKIMKSLLHLFVIKYSPVCNTRRRYIMYFAVTLLTDNITLNTELIKEDDKAKINSIVGKMSNIYQQVKINEVHVLENEKLEKTPQTKEDIMIKKLGIFSTFGDKNIPRI